MDPDAQNPAKTGRKRPPTIPLQGARNARHSVDESSQGDTFDNFYDDAGDRESNGTLPESPGIDHDSSPLLNEKIDPNVRTAKTHPPAPPQRVMRPRSISLLKRIKKDHRRQAKLVINHRGPRS